MSNHVSDNGGKQDSSEQYSNIDSPIIPDQHKAVKDELNLNILRKFIDTLREVEDGQLDQHEASVKVGEVLKQLYIDSALQREKKLDVEGKKRASKHKKPVNNISWAKFKASGLNESA